MDLDKPPVLQEVENFFKRHGVGDFTFSRGRLVRVPDSVMLLLETHGASHPSPRAVVCCLGGLLTSASNFVICLAVVKPVTYFLWLSLKLELTLVNQNSKLKFLPCLKSVYYLTN